MFTIDSMLAYTRRSYESAAQCLAWHCMPFCELNRCKKHEIFLYCKSVKSIETFIYAHAACARPRFYLNCKLNRQCIKNR